MNRRLPAVLSTLLAAGFFAGGCSLLTPRKDPTRFYELTVPALRPPAAAKSADSTVVVAVEVAGYLKNPSLVSRIAANEVRYLPFDQWAEPFAENLSQTVQSGLALETGLLVVGASDSYVTRDAFRVRVEIQRFDILPDQSVNVAAVWQIRTNLTGRPIQQGQFDQTRPFTPNSRSLEPAVAVMSQLIVELNKAIAATLR